VGGECLAGGAGGGWATVRIAYRFFFVYLLWVVVMAANSTTTTRFQL
jgi:hypothetical protein